MKTIVVSKIQGWQHRAGSSPAMGTLRTKMKTKVKKQPKEISSLSLGFGTLKTWDLKTKEQLDILKKYSKLGMAAGAAQQRDTQEQKKLICELIDTITNPRGIFLDWDGVYVSRKKAKQYVMQN